MYRINVAVYIMSQHEKILLWVASFNKSFWIRSRAHVCNLYMMHCFLYIHTQQDVHGRWADALLWACMKVFLTSLFVPDVQKTLHRRRVRVGRTDYVLRTPGRKRTSGKLSYGPKVGRTVDDPFRVGINRNKNPIG